MATTKAKKDAVERRAFLKCAAAGGLASLAASTGAIAQQPATVVSTRAPVPPPETDPNGTVEVLTTDRPGADFMVDVIKSMGFEYVAANPGATFRGLQESLINYGGNKAPEFLTCCHEESAVGMAHGYGDVEGKPMLVLLHSTVGVTHASMNIFNAWCGRTPVYMLIGNTLDATQRGGVVGWVHSAQDVAAVIRDFTKWDDPPISLPHFAESAVRAYKIAMALPMGPVAIVVDDDLQEHPISKGETFRIPKLTLGNPPQGDSASVAEIARLLVAAQNPVIIAGNVVRSQKGMDSFIEFVETLQVPVVDQRGNLPSRHPLNQPGGRGLIQNADVIVGLELEDFWGPLHVNRDQLHGTTQRIVNAGAKLISITNLGSLVLKSNFQDFGRYAEVDLALDADTETTLPALTEAAQRLITDDRRRAFADRGKGFAAAREQAFQRSRAEAVYGWNSNPISLRRLSVEVWEQVKNEDWATVHGGTVGAGILGPEWKYEKYYQRTHGGSAYGVGYVAPSAVGAALAHRKHGRLFVYAQTDGDLMMAPGVLWTAAHHRIPMLTVMHNNRAYHQEVMHIQRMAARHDRGIHNSSIGTTLTTPDIDYAKFAQSMGWFAEGPISDPKELAPAIRRAIDVVKRGQPALLDVVTQPR